MLGAATAMFCVGTLTAISPALHDYPVYGGQALRYTASAILLFVIVKALRLPRVRPTRREILLVVLLAATGLAAFNVFIIEATRHTEPQTVGTIVATVPIILALVGPVSERRRPSLRVVAAAMVVAGGATLMIGLGDASVLGVLLSLGALACEVGFSLLAVPLLPTLGAIRVSAYSAATAVPLLFLFGVVADSERIIRMPTATETAALAYLAVVVTAFAFYCWYDALPRLGAERAGLFSGFLPLGAIVAAMVLRTGRPTVSDFVGVALVIGGLMVGLSRHPAAAGEVQPGTVQQDRKVSKVRS